MTTNTTTPPAAAWIVGSCGVRLWGIDGRERLRRQLRLLGVTRFFDEAPAPDAAPVLIASCEYLLDDRTLAGMLKSPATILEASGKGGTPCAVAAHVRADQAAGAREAIEGRREARTIPGVTVLDSAALGASYVRKVLKANQPLVLLVEPGRAAALERYLFDESYKGVTDLVTKFVWPGPARRVVALCTKLGIRPNAVTAMSLALVILAGWLFAQGRFAEGLAAGWIMTFLDTVDGKLARVTVTSTQFGHLFDHGIDLVHPPLWYVAWAAGLAGGWGGLSATDPTLVAIFAGYLGGRFAEHYFSNHVGGFSLFSWRPFDSFFRLITGRRNPNMLLLTFFTAIGSPGGGLVAVAAWTVVSTIVLAVSAAQGAAAKGRNETLRPWLEQVGPDTISSVPRYARPFLSDPAARLLAG